MKLNLLKVVLRLMVEGETRGYRRRGTREVNMYLQAAPRAVQESVNNAELLRGFCFSALTSRDKTMYGCTWVK